MVLPLSSDRHMLLFPFIIDENSYWKSMQYSARLVGRRKNMRIRVETPRASDLRSLGNFHRLVQTEVDPIAA